jgi:hypothetical protein
VIEVDRFGYILIAPRLESFDPGLVRIVRGNRYDWNLPHRFVLANLSGGCQPVKFGQAQVHENQCRPFLHGQFDSLLAIAGLKDAVSGYFEQSQHHETTVLKILNHHQQFFHSLHRDSNFGKLSRNTFMLKEMALKWLQFECGTSIFCRIHGAGATPLFQTAPRP